MALVHDLEKQGNFLFKYRGQFPIVLFILAVPFIYWTEKITQNQQFVYTTIGVILSIVGFIIRAYTIGTTPKGTSGRNTKQQLAEQLNTSGIYSTVRHPLYLGNYFMWIGIVVFTCNVYYVIIVSLLYFVYYERIMFAEERFLEKKFGQQYIDWALSLPAFIPSFSSFKKSSVPFSFLSVLRREYSGILATVIGFAYVSILRHYFDSQEFFLSKPLMYSLLASVLLTLFLRTLKRHTNLLEEEGRF
ncbi:MAG: methyltransferase family protein [Flavobacteriales bacterium]